MKLPSSLEWPAGQVEGVISMEDGIHVVPLAGRVQLYDKNWRFIRGWNVDAFGGRFRVATPISGRIELKTASGGGHGMTYTFDEAGDLIRSFKNSSSPDFYSGPPPGESVTIPTSPLLWIFSRPLLLLVRGCDWL